MLNCAAIFKFCAPHFFVECWWGEGEGELRRRLSNLRISTLKWYQKIVLILCKIVPRFLNFKLHPFRRYPQGRFESQPPLPILAPKWCQKIVLQFFNFVLFTFLQNAGWGSDTSRPSPIANFDLIMILENCNTIFKFCAAPLWEIFPRRLLEPATHFEFSLFIKKLC